VLDEGGWVLELKMTEKELRQFLKCENLTENQLEPVSVMATVANE
jgi:hypothetical protein